MKKSISLVLITLLFVVLGCSLDKFTGGEKDAPPPTPATDTTAEKPADGAEKPADGAEKPADDKGDSGSTAALSLDKFTKIELGMSYEQVKEIMGSDGNETSSSKYGDVENKSYQWKGDKFASIRASFRNDKVRSKSQSNVGERNGTAQLTQANFNKVNTGMSYDEVKGVLGSEGELTRISKIGESTTTAYTWKGPKYERIFTNFKDDKLQNKSQSSLK